MEVINLLPDRVKSEIIYARKNRVLLLWLMAVAIVIAGVGGMTIFGQIFINKNIDSMQSITKTTQQRIADQDLSATQAEIKSLSDNFTTVTQLLSQQLLFSTMFAKIGNVIPQGAILSGITLSTTNTGIDIDVTATNKDIATQAFVNIDDPTNGLFEKADLESVDCTTVSASNSAAENEYPCTADIRVTLQKNSTFYFLNSITSSGTKS